MTLILGIETSCDETAAALVKDGKEVIASSLASSAELHKKTGGIIPEVAARKQLEFIVPVLDDCLKQANIKPSQIDSIAVTFGPGLIGSLLIGVEAAKALSFAWSKPLIPVNHLVAHIYANFINRDSSEIEFPAAVLIVSGGHTDLVLMKNHGDFQYLGGTLDDAVGEAFDKVARVLGLSNYLGGPAISKAAKNWNHTKPSFSFKRPMIDSKDLNFSFSGIKTAVINKVKESGEKLNVDEVAYEFQEAVADVLVSKFFEAATLNNAKSALLAGGVSANEVLRSKVENAFSQTGIKVLLPPLNLCTDNAVSIASCAYYNNNLKPLSEIQADPGLSIMG